MFACTRVLITGALLPQIWRIRTDVRCWMDSLWACNRNSLPTLLIAPTLVLRVFLNCYRGFHWQNVPDGTCVLTYPAPRAIPVRTALPYRRRRKETLINSAFLSRVRLSRRSAEGLHLVGTDPNRNLKRLGVSHVRRHLVLARIVRHVVRKGIRIALAESH